MVSRVVPMQLAGFVISFFVGVGVAVTPVKREITVGACVNTHFCDILHIVRALIGCARGDDRARPHKQAFRQRTQETLDEIAAGAFRISS